MPTVRNKEYAVQEGPLDADNLFPLKRGFYHFEGSLTTPPCTEGVQWFVLKQAITISDAQYQTFTALYPYNARPVQKTNGRQIVQGP